MNLYRPASVLGKIEEAVFTCVVAQWSSFTPVSVQGKIDKAVFTSVVVL